MSEKFGTNGSGNLKVFIYIYRAVKGGVVNRGSFTIFSKGGGEI